MHNMIATVFKVLGGSILIMFLLDVIFIVADTITVNNRIESISLVMQDELSRNNCIPDSIAPLFLNQLKEIQKNSNVVSQEADGIVSNIDRDLTIDGVRYESVAESNVKNYGDKLTLVIQVKMQPQSLIFFKTASNNYGSFLGRKTFEYTMTYKYPVPALRYLK